MPAGTVAEFDDHRGYGEVETAGGERYFFHCSAIAGGTRTIAEGATVTFDLRPGHLGRWEATAVTPIG